MLANQDKPDKEYIPATVYKYFENKNLDALQKKVVELNEGLRAKEH